jgi:hypothetical protein
MRCRFLQLCWRRPWRLCLNEFMTPQIYVSSEEVQWEFAAGVARNIDKIRAELDAAFACNGIVLDGPGPMFVEDSGKTNRGETGQTEFGSL